MTKSELYAHLELLGLTKVINKAEDITLYMRAGKEFNLSSDDTPKVIFNKFNDDVLLYRQELYQKFQCAMSLYTDKIRRHH